MRRVTVLFLGPVLFGLVVLAVQPVRADVSVFVGRVNFDDDAHLEGSLGLGARLGKSGRLWGGETALLIARPEREVGGTKETATAFFYEGRFVVNLPAGRARPFFGVGFGAVTVTSTAVPESGDAAVVEALKAIAELQTNSALSYGGGIKYALNEYLELRADLRQYLVFSVRGLAARELQRQAEARTGVDLPDELTEDSTVRYGELSLGLGFKF